MTWSPCRCDGRRDRRPPFLGTSMILPRSPLRDRTIRLRMVRPRPRGVSCRWPFLPGVRLLGFGHEPVDLLAEVVSQLAFEADHPPGVDDVDRREARDIPR